MKLPLRLVTNREVTAVTLLTFLFGVATDFHWIGLITGLVLAILVVRLLRDQINAHYHLRLRFSKLLRRVAK